MCEESTHGHKDQSCTSWLELNSRKEQNTQRTVCMSAPFCIELFTAATAFSFLKFVSDRSRLTSWKDPKGSGPEAFSADIFVALRVSICNLQNMWLVY